MQSEEAVTDINADFRDGAFQLGYSRPYSHQRSRVARRVGVFSIETYLDYQYYELRVGKLEL